MLACALLLGAILVALSSAACSGRHPAPANESAVVEPTPMQFFDGPCPVTVPNGMTPPGERPNAYHHGNGLLWTGLWPEGTVVFQPGGPGSIEPDGSMAMKFWFWSTQGAPSIEGRRLDGPAPPLRASIPGGYAGPFQATSLIFPTEGCWEVSAKAGTARLTFVTKVVLIPQSMDGAPRFRRELTPERSPLN